MGSSHDDCTMIILRTTLGRFSTPMVPMLLLKPIFLSGQHSWTFNVMISFSEKICSRSAWMRGWVCGLNGKRFAGIYVGNLVGHYCSSSSGSSLSSAFQPGKVETK